MATIKALRTIAGTYGTLNVGKTAEVSDSTAADLEKRKLVTIVKTSTKEDTNADTRNTKEDKGAKTTK